MLKTLMNTILMLCLQLIRFPFLLNLSCTEISFEGRKPFIQTTFSESIKNVLTSQGHLKGLKNYFSKQGF